LPSCWGLDRALRNPRAEPTNSSQLNMTFSLSRQIPALQLETELQALGQETFGSVEAIFLASQPTDTDTHADKVRSPNSCPEVEKHLQQHENAVEGEACYYHCVLCSYSTKAKLNLIQHVRSMKHQRSESLRKLQRLQKGLPEEEEDLTSIFTIRKCSSSDTGELSEDVEAASETTTDQEDQTKDRESGGEKELTKGTAVSGHSERHQSDSPIPSKRPSSRSETSESPLSSKRPRTAEKSAAEQ
ncbi:hypothetical protein JOQ06_009838, partial [Pogonophryne albipinna]